MEYIFIFIISWIWSGLVREYFMVKHLNTYNQYKLDFYNKTVTFKE